MGLSKSARFICMFMSLLMVLGVLFSATTSVYARKTNNDLTEVLENSFMFNDSENSFYIDRERAFESGLTEENMRNVDEFIAYLESNPESKLAFKKELGLTIASFNPIERLSARALPLFVIADLKLAGQAIAGAIIATVVKHGIATACKKFQGNIKIFDNYCKSNGW